MVKNKAKKKKKSIARLCQTLHPPSGHSLSLSLPHRLGPIKAGLTCLPSLSLSLSLADAVYPEGIPWILPRLDPGTLQ